MNRLIEAVLTLWESGGAKRTTLKAVTQQAAVAGSSLYHHFGGLDRLFLSAQEVALDRAERWCASQLDILPGIGQAIEAFPRVMAALIDQWCVEERRLAFAWRECQLMAWHNPAYLPPTRRWLAIWTRFWSELCSRFGCREHGLLTCHFFDAESLLHLIRWRRPLDRACLDEICEGWGDWLAGRLSDERQCRAFAREQAAALMPELAIRDEITQRIADAAADTLALDGFGALTHRAVAARAGLTLGVVAYHVKSSADLSLAAFETAYRRTLNLTREGGALRRLPVARWKHALRDQTEPVASLSSIDQLFLEAARNPGLAAFAPQLRYLRGRSGRAFLQSLAGPDRPVSNLDAAIFSAVLTGNLRSQVDHAFEANPPDGSDCLDALTAMVRLQQGNARA